MAGTNDFQAFATGGSANVLTQSAYAALTTLIANGFQSGVANSQQLNKVWRQSSVVAAAIGSIVASANLNALDDGNISVLAANIRSALAGAKAGVAGLSAASTLTVADSNKLFVLTASSTGYTTTLPAVSTVQSGATFTFMNISSAAMSVARAGSDVIYVSGSTLTAMTLNNGDNLTLVSTGTYWIAIEGSAQLPYAAAMAGANWTTPAQFDNTTKLATTEFVQRALGNLAGVDSYSAGSTSLTAAKAGRLQVLAANSGVALTLPAVSGCPAGTVFRFHAAYASGSGTVTRAGTDIIYFGSTAVNTITFNGGDTLELTSTGSSWYATGGSLELAYSAGAFGASLTGTGYQKLPTGLIVQWGSFTTNSSGNATITYPIAFPNTLFRLVATAATQAGSAVVTENYSASTATTIPVTMTTSTNGVGVSSGVGYWIAVGN